MSSSNKFGTFGGVFTPSILTILGVIMYLRLPAIIGQGGLYITLGIIFGAHVISLATGLSVSSIATDKKVKAGGTYYMISRSLGLPIGGTLGLALFAGLSFSVSLYLIGFAESLLGYIDGYEANALNIRIVGTIALVAVTAITFISTSLALKSQYFIMAAIIISLISIFAGDHEWAPAVPQLNAMTGAPAIMLLFGIFFPAVTGFEAGVSMSGDLKDPKKSIPAGSIWAIGVGLLVYVGLSVFLTFTVDGQQLANDPKVLYNIAWMPELVLLGVCGATLSSALGSILGAPRILQATAIDKITSSFFAKGHGSSNEPRNALLLTFVIAEAGILIGELDVIAAVVSVFFITIYAFLNLSCAFEAWSSADFRPQFRIPIWVSLLGALACLVVMILLEPLAMLAATLLLGALLFYLQRKTFTLESGDAWSGIWASLVKSGLENLKKEELHRRNWRPNILLFSGGDQARPHLIEMGEALASNLGILSDFELLPGKGPLMVRSANNKAKAGNIRYFKHRYECQEIYRAIEELSRIYGFASVEPNTILMGWTKKEKNQEAFAQLLQSFKKTDYNACFLYYRESRQFGNHQNIDIWWSGKGRNLALAISLIRYIGQSQHWQSIKPRLLIVNDHQAPPENIHKQATAILESYRVEMEIKIINNNIEQQPLQALMLKESSESDLSIIGIPPETYKNGLTAYIEDMQELLPQLGTSLLISASNSFEEWEVALEAVPDTLPKVQLQATLPDLQPVRHFVLQHDIQKIDEHGQKLQEAFFYQSIAPFFQEMKKASIDCQQLGKHIFHSLSEANKQEGNYKKKKELSKLRNDSYFRVKKLLEQLNLSKISEQFVEGVEWYGQKQKESIARFPQEITLEYDPVEFKVQKGDTWKIKRFKWKKTMVAAIKGKPVELHIPYRKAANWFLLDRRQDFLATYLHAFYFDCMKLLSTLKNNLSFLYNSLIQLEEEALSGRFEEAQINAKQEALAQKLQDFQASINEYRELYFLRLTVSFREDVNNMGVLLSSMMCLDELKILKHETKHKNWIEASIQSYTDTWGRNLGLYSNNIYLEWTLNGAKSRLQEWLHDLKEEVSYELQQFYGKELERLEQSVKEIRQDSETALYELRIPDSQRLFMILEKYRSNISGLVDALPEHLFIMEEVATDSSLNSENKDDIAIASINVPVARMAGHFVEVHLTAGLQSAFDQLQASLVKILYAAKDQAHLVKFHLDNIDENSQEIIQKAITNIGTERTEIVEAGQKLAQSNQQALANAFEPLSPFKITGSTKEFSQYLRDYQGQKVLSGANKLLGKADLFFKQQTAKVLYSKSKGVLLAKKLTDTDLPGTNAGRLLDMVEQYTPQPKLLTKLPYYYSSLFSGRSMIDDDFWIHRPYEENAIKKAIRRYKQGYYGAILLLGSRNAGKSILAKRSIEKHYQPEKLIQVYPPPSGSTSIDDFDQALVKAIGTSGRGINVLQSLPKNSVVILHDVELWWERSPQGLEVMEYIKGFVNLLSEEMLFILNTNLHAYQLMQAAMQLDELFIQVVECQPFDASELQELILKRHQSSGLGVNVIGSSGVGLADWRMAKVFNQIFNLSGGNPGSALSLWMASIKAVKNQEISIDPPKPSSLSELKSISDTHWLWLAQFSLHKRMTVEKFQRTLRLPEEEIEEHLKGLMRTGMIKELYRGVYIINEYLDHYIVRALKNRELL